MEKLATIETPFTDDQVREINNYHIHGRFHPFTCCSPEFIPECVRAGRIVDGEYVPGKSQGILLATNDGLVCPCGKYKQNWVYKFMTENQ